MDPSLFLNLGTNWTFPRIFLHAIDHGAEVSHQCVTSADRLRFGIWKMVVFLLVVCFGIPFLSVSSPTIR